MKYLLPIALVAALFSCTTNTQKPATGNNYFEGAVEFNIVIKTQDPEMAAILKKAFGSRAITYLSKKGYFSREYIDSNNIILAKDIYRPDSLRFYSYRGNLDTVYYVECKDSNNSKLIQITKKSSTKILGHTVDIVKLRTEEKGTPSDKPFYIYTTYCNDINYDISPLSYVHMRANNVEEVFSASPHVTTGVILQYGDIATITCTATRITPSVVEDRDFEIPKNRIIAKQPEQ